MGKSADRLDRDTNSHRSSCLVGEVHQCFAGEPVKVYDGTITVAVWLRAKPNTSGSETLTLRLRYQACDEKRCLMPSEINFGVTVSVLP
ncbi:MAG: hypothetical protein LM632_00360 [Armatimonadetes bacterium]|nr:hypothetical protein [Armatimonadota bacterium]